MDSPSKNMRFDVCSVEEGQDVLHHISELRRIESFAEYPGTPGGELNRDLVVKYVVILYSLDSFLNVKPVTVLEERKLMAADAAGFKRNKNNDFDVEIQEKLFNLRSLHVLNMIVDFLKFQNRYLWTSIVSTEQALYESTKIIMTPVSDDKDKDNVTSMKSKLQLIPLNQETKKTLDALYHEFFTDNTDVKELHDVKDKATLEKRARPA
jgi:hypothetical protein